MRKLVLFVLIVFFGVRCSAQTYSFGTDSFYSVIKVIKNASKDSVSGFEITIKNTSSKKVFIGYYNVIPACNAFLLGKMLVVNSGGRQYDMAMSGNQLVNLSPLGQGDSVKCVVNISQLRGSSYFMLSLDEYASLEKIFNIDYLTNVQRPSIDYEGFKRAKSTLIAVIKPDE